MMNSLLSLLRYAGAIVALTGFTMAAAGMVVCGWAAGQIDRIQSKKGESTR